MNYELNKTLIMYYEAVKTKYVEFDLDCVKGEWNFADIVGNTVILTRYREDDDKYLLFVTIKHEDHFEMVPLLSIGDL